MANRGDFEWKQSTEVYSPDQVEAVLNELGIEVKEETEHDFISLCPYHGNRDTPAFSTSKDYGYSICFNPSCAKGEFERLTLEQLVRDQTGMNHFEAKRFVMRRKTAGGKSIDERLADIMARDPDELKEFPSEAIATMHDRFLNDALPAQEFMKGRGFELQTMLDFNVGFTPATVKPIYKPDMVVVPAYDHKGRPVGLVGRSIEGKKFKNFGAEKDGSGFRKSKIVWNLHNAKRYESLVITEATFDAMRVHQSGYPNVGAVLGGSFSLEQEALIKRHFSKVIIMTDNDAPQFIRHCRKCLRAKYDMCQGHQPGRDLGLKIAERLKGISVSWAAYDDNEIYADDAKDASDMTDEQIRQCLRNAIPHYEYVAWRVA